MTSRASNGSHRNKTAEMFAMLMWGPQTPRTLTRNCDITFNAANDFLKSLHAAGVVRIVGRWKLFESETGHLGRIYELQKTPFALSDEHDVRWLGDPPTKSHLPKV